jgi:hypothetical protein
VNGAERPLIGDEMYPLLLAKTGDGGHITQTEFNGLRAWHEQVVRAREARA